MAEDSVSGTHPELVVLTQSVRNARGAVQQRNGAVGNDGLEVSPWRTQEALAQTRDVRLKAVLGAARGPAVCKVDQKCWLWIGGHTLGLTILLLANTRLSDAAAGALLLGSAKSWDGLYFGSIVALLALLTMLYASLYHSDPGWVTPGVVPPGHLLPPCKFCGLRAPLRSRHNNSTGQCVIKFDHFCTLLSTAIGDVNHARFLLFLFLQSVTLIWGIYLAFGGIARCVSPRNATQQAVCWSSSPGRTLLLALTGMAMLSLLGLFLHLLAVHTYLACTGQTTFELMKGATVPYLAAFYAGYNGPQQSSLSISTVGQLMKLHWKGNPPPAPFSQGLRKNLQIFFFAKKPYDYKFQWLPSSVPAV